MLKPLLSKSVLFMAKVIEQTSSEDIRHDYEHLAHRANLRYVSDDERVIREVVGDAALLIVMPLARP